MDPSYPYNFPPPPPLPSSADLFDAQETTDLFGFLDQFGANNNNNNNIWDSYDAYMLPPRSAPPSFPHHLIHPQQPPPHSAPSTSSRRPSPPPASSPSTPRAKPLLSTPQKRLNHIMSEQKRRNAIRDGYAQLIALLGDPAAAMPTRGRPKGRGGANKTAGKSGVLFRAVEYVRFLEEGRDALKREVERLEARKA